MHKIEISPAVMDRVKASRGRTHMFDRLDPARTAHIIVDLQNGFMEPGATVEIPMPASLFEVLGPIPHNAEVSRSPITGIQLASVSW